MRIRYRVNQFLKALKAKPEADQLSAARRVLNTAQMQLFLEMQPNEQAHSLEIYQELVNAGEKNQDLLTAALLHDVGKSRYPLALWERMIIVISGALIPQKVHQWGNSTPTGWRRPFVIAEKHSAWGAEMAAQAGASPIAIDLIRRHQNKIKLKNIPDRPPRPEDDLLFRLQQFDDQN